MIREIFPYFMNYARAICLIALAVYLLSLAHKYLSSEPRNPPPCETCIHLAKKQKDGAFDNKCWKCEEHGWQYQSLCYCKDYVPREKDEEFEPAESVAVGLEPCPVCGKTMMELSRFDFAGGFARWIIRCKKCGYYSVSHSSSEEAVKYWNEHRVPPRKPKC